MRVKLFTLRFSATLGGFDETPLREFTRDKELLSVRDHFFVAEGVPHLSCLLTYQDPVVPPEVLHAAREAAPAAQAGGNGRRASRDPAAGLDEAGRALFNALREWRAETARTDGVPPYVVLTNKQLVQLVQRRPASPTALATIEGIGPAKVKRYGEAVLRLLHGRAASNEDTQVQAGSSAETRSRAEPDPDAGGQTAGAAGAAPMTAANGRPGTGGPAEPSAGGNDPKASADSSTDVDEPTSRAVGGEAVP